MSNCFPFFVGHTHDELLWWVHSEWQAFVDSLQQTMTCFCVISAPTTPLPPSTPVCTKVCNNHIFRAPTLLCVCGACMCRFILRTPLLQIPQSGAPVYDVQHASNLLTRHGIRDLLNQHAPLDA